ncbi:TetR/AcrR family transcriptional regulator [Starkeya sp. ORNL1]|uniref:TetR/AcrR family transcriptional regulator n=1 Tax=Starkeya sp. ORNL1 TaxID=2709380 RepID=UPI001463132D|nr:TetR/AcrR family transcriptional regulator [Starkeya sp. ORNL1]QJP17670.1 TetR/AcrR family transcriptional regulator [Starkeya sp. ORNL1]
MVQNRDTKTTRRGRPRAYDPQAALQRARDKFWMSGYSRTSLDEICAATGMNRPSLYAAFGDKHSLYLKALEQYWSLVLGATTGALQDSDQTLREALMRAYDEQLSIYFSEDGSSRGCFAIGTATTEAAEDREIRDVLAEGLRGLDADFEARLQIAHQRGELKNDANPAALAVLASATLHTLAIRARAGVNLADLREIARKAVDVICG